MPRTQAATSGHEWTLIQDDSASDGSVSYLWACDNCEETDSTGHEAPPAPGVCRWRGYVSVVLPSDVAAIVAEFPRDAIPFHLQLHFDALVEACAKAQPAETPTIRRLADGEYELSGVEGHDIHICPAGKGSHRTWLAHVFDSTIEDADEAHVESTNHDSLQEALDFHLATAKPEDCRSPTCLHCDDSRFVPAWPDGESIPCPECNAGAPERADSILETKPPSETPADVAGVQRKGPVEPVGDSQIGAGGERA